jgi:signal transduction histidine kinase
MSERPIDAGSRGDDHVGDPHERVELLIDQLKQRTSELEEANRELRRVSHYRSLFLARMSHELRTPLTAILGFSEILLDQEELTDTQRRFCQKVQDSGFQLQASLNQLVDLSRVEAGQTEVFLQEFAFREILRESCAAVARMAQKQQVVVEYELAPDISTVVSDQGKVRQILFNFIAWAVSRSPAGGNVKILVDINANVLNIRVQDEGEPLDPASHVFDPEEGATAREPNINELGIIIGRKLLELLSGTVTLTSVNPRGLEATIQLPARPLKG